MEDWTNFRAELDKAMPRGWNPEAEARLPFARWAQGGETLTDKWRWREGDASILLGKYQGEEIARLDDNRHIITIAGTRAGKGRSLILPNLAMWPGSVIAIDPKGELAAKTARWRYDGLKQSVVVLDPFGVSGWDGNSYNPLDDLDAQSVTFMDDVSLVADALIIPARHDSHWTDGAKNLVRVIILYMLAEGTLAATLPRLRKILLGREGMLSSRETAEKGQINLFERMQAMTAFDGYVSLAGRTFYEKSERELSSILSVAREQLSFLDSESMTKVLQPSKVRLPEVKKIPTTIYLCLPAARLSTHFRWLRVVVNLALAALGTELEKHHSKDVPVLLLLEEFAALEKMEAVEKAAGQIAGFGVKALGGASGSRTIGSHLRQAVGNLFRQRRHHHMVRPERLQEHGVCVQTAR